MIESETILHAYFISARALQKMVTYQNGGGHLVEDSNDIKVDQCGPGQAAKNIAYVISVCIMSKGVNV